MPQGFDSEGLPQELRRSLEAEYAQFLLDSQLERWLVVVSLEGNRLIVSSGAPDGVRRTTALKQAAPGDLRVFLDEEYRRWEEREHPGRSWSSFGIGALQVDITTVFWVLLLVLFQIFSPGAGFSKPVNFVTALHNAGERLLYLGALWLSVRAVALRRP
jgi:hypothetical protein